MKSFIRALVILASACTLGIAAQGEAKSKHKDKEHKVKSEKHEKKSRKHDKKHKKDKENVIEVKKEEPLPTIVIEQPIVELLVIEQPAPIGERK